MISAVRLELLQRITRVDDFDFAVIINGEIKNLQTANKELVRRITDKNNMHTSDVPKFNSELAKSVALVERLATVLNVFVSPIREEYASMFEDGEDALPEYEVIE